MKSSLLSFVIAITVLVCLAGCVSLKEYQEQAVERDVPFLITEYGQAGATSKVGGVSYEMSFLNLSGKTIKYLYLSVTPFDLMGDVAPSVVNERAEVRLLLKGPIETDVETDFTWENVWYNKTITCIEINSVEIRYVGGSTETLKKDELQKALAQTLEENTLLNSCK